MFDITKNDDGTFTVTETHSLAETSYMPLVELRSSYRGSKDRKGLLYRFEDMADLSSPQSYKEWVKAWKEVEKLIVKYQRHYKLERKTTQLLANGLGLDEATKVHYARVTQVHCMSWFAHAWIELRKTMKIEAAKAREQRLVA